MSEITSSLRKHKRQPNMLDQNRMSLAAGKNIGPYEVLDIIKEGSSSKIYKARSRYNHEYVAIKAINKSKLKNNLDDLLLITKQIETLKILKHRNIVTLYEIYESKKYIYLITEYLSGKDLIEKLIHKKRFNEEEALRIFFQLLDALTYMHKMNICHRNLRAEHILFDKNNRPKIVGFGFSSFYEPNKTIEGAYGSLCYACPEILDETQYNPELADVWSLGVILYVLVCGYLPFSDEDDKKNRDLIVSGAIDFPKELSAKLKDLLKHMLDVNPNRRYNFLRVVKHPWIKPYGIKIFSQGINIHKTIFPVDERLLNIIKEYGFDKDTVKKDLIMNKYNIGTGLYKQIVRKLLDLKKPNISDLCSQEFMDYRDDEKNKYEDGDKKYEKFIEKIDGNYRKKEDFINDFKEREEKVAERLLYLKDKRDEKLNTIEEAILDNAEDENEENKNKSDNEIDNKDKEDKNINNIRTVKTQRNKLFPRTKTPMFTFDELMKAKRINNSNNINKNKNKNKNFNNNDNILNDDNIQIIYNKDDDVDIIQKFQDEQNKKLSENIIMEKPTHKKTPSTPNFGKGSDTNTTVVSETPQFKLSITPEKTDNLAKKLLDQNPVNDKKKNLYNNSLFSNINKVSLYSNINSGNLHSGNLYSGNLYSGNLNSGNINNNNYKSIISGNTIATLYSNNSNNNSKSLFRMTTVRKSNNKSYLSRGSLYDDFLKKNHPDNIRKTILNKSKFSKNTNKINEGIKENEESESEKNDKKKEEDNNNEEELKKSIKLRYSISFGDDEEEEEEDEDKEEDQKLFHLLENEDDEELKEIRNFYFGEEKNKKNAKEGEKMPKKSIIKKKSVRFTSDERNRDKSNDLKKSTFSKMTTNSNNNGSVFEGLEKYEAKLKKYDSNFQNEKENILNSGRIRFGSQLEYSFHNDDDEKFNVNIYSEYAKFNNDEEPIKNLDFLNNDMCFSIGDIYNKINKNFLLKVNKDIPNQKINVFNESENFSHIDKINDFFRKYQEQLNNDKKRNGKLSNDKNEKEDNGYPNNQENNVNNTKDKTNNRDEIVPSKKDESTQTQMEEGPHFKNIKKMKQANLTIQPNVNNEYFKDTNHHSYYDNGNSNTYNGNNPIDISNYNTYNQSTYTPNSYNFDMIPNKKNNPSHTTSKGKPFTYREYEKEPKTMRYNQSYSNISYNLDKDNKINKVLKRYYYKNDNKNVTVDQETIIINKSKYLKPQSPKTNKIPTGYNTGNYSTNDNTKKRNFDTSGQIHKFKSHFSNYDEIDNNMFSTEDPNFSKTLPRKRGGYNSVKNIKDEVIVKRNEIIEKIQHCQNLLNTIMNEKKQFTKRNTGNFYTVNSSTFTFTKRLTSLNEIDNNKHININNFNTHDNYNNINTDINNLYIKDNKEPKMYKNFAYKKINVKYNDKLNNKHYIDINNKEKNDVSLPEKYIKKKFSNATTVNDNKKDIYNNTNYYSENQENHLCNTKRDNIPISTRKKFIGLYDNNSYSYNTNINKKGNQSFNKIPYRSKFNPKDNNDDPSVTNDYQNKNEGTNNKSTKTRRIIIRNNDFLK